MTPSEQYISRLEACGKWNKNFTSRIIECRIRALTTYSYYICDLCSSNIQSLNNETNRIKITFRDLTSSEYQIKTFYVCSNLAQCDHRRFVQVLRPGTK